MLRKKIYHIGCFLKDSQVGWTQLRKVSENLNKGQLQSSKLKQKVWIKQKSIQELKGNFLWSNIYIIGNLAGEERENKKSSWRENDWEFSRKNKGLHSDPRPQNTQAGF